MYPFGSHSQAAFFVGDTVSSFKYAVFDANLFGTRRNPVEHVRVQPRIAAQQYGDKNKFYKLVANSKIFKFATCSLIYFNQHIVALRCVDTRRCFNWIPS